MLKNKKIITGLSEIKFSSLINLKIKIHLFRFYFYFLLFSFVSFIAQIYSVPGVPFFHIDLLLLTPFLYSSWANLLIVLSILISIARVIQWFYGFEQLFISIYFFSLNISTFPLSVIFISIFTALAILFLILFFYNSKIVINKEVSISALLVVFVMCATAKYAEDYTRKNIIGTSYGYLIGQFKFSKMFYDSYEIPMLSKEPYPGSMGANHAIKNKTNLVLILVESLGEPNLSSEKSNLFSGLYSENIKNKYEIDEGSITAFGSTIHGEIRELCGGRLSQGIFGENADDCIPKMMVLAGYQTTAIHANYANVYGRNKWYPKMGFINYINTESENFPSNNTDNRWGSLLDTSLFQWLYKAPVNSKKRFEYILTVSTHLPAVLIPGVNLSLSCRTNLNENACIHLSNLKSVLDEIAIFAVSRENTTFVIVGDHPPPFVNLSSKGAFKHAVVPYMILKPKGDFKSEIRPLID
jgi:hypothetical protein